MLYSSAWLISRRFHLQISCSLAREAVWTVLEIARSSGGAANFRFGVSFNGASSLTPFFPAACSSALAPDSSPAFAFGLENSALLVAACRAAAAKTSGKPDLEAVGRSVERAWESVLHRLTQIGLQYEWDAAQKGCKFVFKGTDTSINPCMRPGQGIGDAYKLVLEGGLGAPGTTALTERLTRAIRAAGAMQTGYRGVMLALAEDPSLAALAEKGRVSAGLLLSWAAVCGVGVDTVPCPCPEQYTKEEEEVVDGLVGVLLDAAALSRRLDGKPLSVRFLPAPGKKAGELATFDSPHLVPSMTIPRLGHGA